MEHLSTILGWASLARRVRLYRYTHRILSGNIFCMITYTLVFCVRFGSQVCGVQGSAKCVVAKLRIYLSDGTEATERPTSDK